MCAAGRALASAPELASASPAGAAESAAGASITSLALLPVADAEAGAACCVAARAARRFCFRMAELYLFLMALSVRPGMYFTICDQCVPYLATMSMMARSSSSVHCPFFTSPERWLNHRSRHCLPTRPGRYEATVDHFCAPCCSTICARILSSSGVHAFLEMPVFDLLGTLSSPSSTRGGAAPMCAASPASGVFMVTLPEPSMAPVICWHMAALMAGERMCAGRGCGVAGEPTTSGMRGTPAWICCRCPGAACWREFAWG
mmetsp:Transcript_7175/g.19502  ORF Transcript_7175/g.19502 Transcript_7175/m.19502 type:complete len:260 (-) Transcript_7175:157-936(-)